MRKKLLTAALISIFLTCLNLQAYTAPLEPSEDRRFDKHRAAKHFMYGTLLRQTARNVSRGTDQPLLKFRVMDQPQSLFINFEIRPEMVDGLLEYLNMPEEFTLAPIAILEGEEPKLYLSLNIYAVDALEGLLSGLRAEWSVYVQKNGGRVSYMVVDAKAEKLTLDSVNWFSLGTYISHKFDDNGYSSYVSSNFGSFFQSLISIEGIEEAEYIFPNPTWISANDRIYWLNGVADRTYYDGDFVDTPVISIDPSALSYTDTTVWQNYVSPDPVSVLLFEQGFDLVITPWYNVDPE